MFGRGSILQDLWHSFLISVDPIKPTTYTLVLKVLLFQVYVHWLITVCLIEITVYVCTYVFVHVCVCRRISCLSKKKNRNWKYIEGSSQENLSVCLSVCLSVYRSIYLSVHGSTALVALGRFFSFLILYTDGRTSWTVDQPVARPLRTHRTT
jgi:hypothetical protein